MSRASPSVGVEDVWEQKKKTLARYYVNDWIERHAPQFATDLWFVVTDGSGTKTRVPACTPSSTLIATSFTPFKLATTSKYPKQYVLMHSRSSTCYGLIIRNSIVPAPLIYWLKSIQGQC